MKVEFDLSNPQEVEAVKRLIGGAGGAAAASASPTPAPAAAPASAPAPASSPTTAPAPAPAPTPAPAPAPAPVASGAPAPSPAPAAGGVSQADFAAAVQNYAKVNSPKATKAKFAEFGYTKISDVPPERYGELLPHFTVQG